MSFRSARHADKIHTVIRQTKELRDGERDGEMGGACGCPKDECLLWSSCFPLFPLCVPPFSPLHPLQSLTDPHLLSFASSPLLFSPLSAASHFYFPVAPSALPCRILWYTKVSLTLICLFIFFHFPSAAAPTPLFKAVPFWLVHRFPPLCLSVSHWSCSVCCNTIWWQQVAVKPMRCHYLIIHVDSMIRLSEYFRLFPPQTFTCNLCRWACVRGGWCVCMCVYLSLFVLTYCMQGLCHCVCMFMWSKVGPWLLLIICNHPVMSSSGDQKEDRCTSLISC